MKVRLAYGREGLTVELPDDRTVVVEPRYLPGLPDEAGALRDALRNPLGAPPLRRSVRPHQRVAIAVCDVTRPMPSRRVLPVLLGELAHVPPERVSILIATGSHRACRPDELRELLGDAVVERYHVFNHDAFDAEGLAYVGETDDGVPIWLNRRWVESEVRITTGFVEPHFFAGFSGGPKMVAPGLAGIDTIMELHSARRIGHPAATWAVTQGNPVHDAIREIARRTGVHFSLDVTLNKDGRITSCYAGELFAVHKAACDVVRRSAMRPLAQTFDVVLTTNGGYPLDRNLYQAVKGMSAAAQVVRPGGAIVCVAQCVDGVPDHGDYARILASADGPEALLRMIQAPGFRRPDQWQVQIQARVLMKARVFLKADGLMPQQVRRALLEPVEDVEATVTALLEEYGPSSRLCVLPEGPFTVPYVAAPEATQGRASS